MLISFKVEKLVIAAIPDLVGTWTEGFGFIPVEDREKQSLNKINLMVFPGTVLLKKPLCENKTAYRHPGKVFFPSFYTLLFILQSSENLIDGEHRNMSYIILGNGRIEKRMLF